jgi:large subunit ribosomal protein L30
MAKQLKITQIRSAIKRQQDQWLTLRALGIRKMNQTVIRPDNPSVRGMIQKIRHLLDVEEISG